jgi:hypothetical protein
VRRTHRSVAGLIALTMAACARGGSSGTPGAGQATDAGATEPVTVPSPGGGPPLGTGPAFPAGLSPAGSQAGDAGAAPEADAGASEVAPVPLSAAVAVVSGQDVPIGRDGSALVDAGASFRVEIAVPLTDGRLALHDEQDAMVASSGTSEVGASWTRYHLVPDEPLRPGTTYVLRVDGAVTREAHDPSGRAYAPLVLVLKTAGERPAPAPARKRRGKHR